MRMACNRQLILEDGQVYRGTAFGADCERVCEVVCNTSMVGYQEILSDPSYTDQAVVMTYPLIGNYGMAQDDYECLTPSIGALIVRTYNAEPSNCRSVATLGAKMQAFGIPGIAGLDTRKLTRSIRDCGSRRALLTDASLPLADGLEMLRTQTTPHDAVSRVSRRDIAVYAPESYRHKVVAIDCGMKQNIVRALCDRGCQVTVVPWNTAPEVIAAQSPDGILLSNGPGDPTDVQETIHTVQALLGRYPMFGICLGHQLLALAYGANTYKMQFGHRGGNHPVRELDTGTIAITSQNHSYAIAPDSLRHTPLTVTHINLLDRTIEGVCCEKDGVFSVQYHPESAPGPQDSAYLFDRFLARMEGYRNA